MINNNISFHINLNQPILKRLINRIDSKIELIIKELFYKNLPTFNQLLKYDYIAFGLLLAIKVKNPINITVQLVPNEKENNIIIHTHISVMGSQGDDYLYFQEIHNISSKTHIKNNIQNSEYGNDFIKTIESDIFNKYTTYLRDLFETSFRNEYNERFNVKLNDSKFNIKPNLPIGEFEIDGEILNGNTILNFEINKINQPSGLFGSIKRSISNYIWSIKNDKRI